MMTFLMPLPDAVITLPETETEAAVGAVTVTVPFCELITKFCARSFDALTPVNVMPVVPAGAFAATVKVALTSIDCLLRQSLRSDLSSFPFDRR
jgi:hypothetical protein